MFCGFCCLLNLGHMSYSMEIPWRIKLLKGRNLVVKDNRELSNDAEINF